MKCEWSPSTSSSYRTCQRSGVSRFDPSDHDNCGSPLCGNVAPLCAQCGKPTVHRHGYVSTHAPEQCIAELRAQLATAEAKLATAIKERDKYKAAYEREQRTHEILKSCGYDVSALGIDPSKGQEK